MTDRSPQNQDKFVVRLPDGMRDRIKAAAEANNRSMNAEIVATLQEKYPVTNLLKRLQAMMHLADDIDLDDVMTPDARNEEIKAVKDHALRIIRNMSTDELRRARREIWYPGILDMFDDWPPQGWHDRSR